MLTPKHAVLLGAVISIASTATSKILEHTTEDLQLPKILDDDLAKADQLIDSNDLSNVIPEGEYFRTPTYLEQGLDEKDWNNLGNDIYPDRVIIEDSSAFLSSKDSNGKTPIMLAIERDNTEVAQALVEYGVDINQRLDSDEINLLHFAASCGSIKCIRWLVERGVNVNDTDEARHWMPIHHAVCHGKLQAVQVLLEAQSCISCKDKWGFTPLMRAIQRDDTAIAAALVESGDDVNQRVDFDNTSLLHLAASNGSVDSVRWLIEKGIDVNDTDDSRQWIPLHHAVFHGKLEAVKVLIELQSCISCKDKWGFTPLMRAIQRDDAAIAEVLLNYGADVNQRLESNEINLLHFAATNGSPKCIRLLVACGLNVNATDVPRKWIPLHHAVFHGKFEAVKALLDLKSCVTCNDKWAFSPLMRAIQRDDTTIAATLVESGADVNRRLESNSVNFLHFAASSGSPKSIKWLVEKGLNVNATDLPRRWIPLHHAIFHGKLEAAKVLIELKSCLTCKDKWGFSPIMRAVQRDDVPIATELVDAGVDINEALDPDKINVLHFAATSGSINSIRWLVARGMNVNQTDVARQWIPLHHAIFHGKFEAAKVLLDLNSCVSCEDKWNFSPLMRAVQRDDITLAKKLVDSGADVHQRLESNSINFVHFAAACGSPKSIRWLVGLGLNVNEKDVPRKWIPLHHAVFHENLKAVEVLLELKSCVSCEDKWNFTPIMRAVHRDDLATAAALEESGADVKQRLDADSITLLHFAASSGSPDCIRWLVRKGLNVNDADEAKGWVPLHHAAFHGKLQSCKVLVSLQSCVNCRDRQDSTPLRLALRNNHSHVAAYLRSVDGKE